MSARTSNLPALRPTRLVAAACLLAALLLAAAASGTEIVHQVEWSNWTSIQSALWTDPARDLEAADDFDFDGTVERILVAGRNACTAACLPPPVAGAYVRFYEWTSSGPGALQREYFLDGSDPLLVYDATWPAELDITLPDPFQATGRHFLSVQLTFGEGFWWAISVGNHGKAAGLPLYARDNLAGGPWEQQEDITGTPLHDDLDFTLYGTPAGGSAPRELIAGCGEWEALENPNLGPVYDANLRAVEVISPTDVWAVGELSELTGNLDQFSLAFHWDGTSWSQVPTPSPAPAPELTWISLDAVEGTGTDDVWAGGSKNDYDGDGIYIGTHIFLMHWDGGSWTEQDVPIPGGGGTIYQQGAGDRIHDIAVIGPDDAWFVGAWFEITDLGAAYRMPLAMHWDGSGFEVFETPDLSGGEDVMNAVAAVAPDDIWAVGEGESDASQIYHFDGTSWSQVPGPTPGWRRTLRDVVALARDDVWAGGSFDDDTGGHPWLLHWDGSSWTTVPAPAGGDMFAAWSPDDILTQGSGGFAHWDGSSWTQQPGLEGLLIPGAVVADMETVGPCELWGVGSRNTVGDFYTLTARLAPPPLPTADADQDLVPDIEDNCRRTFNPAQEDCDSDEIGDACAVSLGADSDCNHNVEPDACDVLEGFSLDTNGNHMPDECEPRVKSPMPRPREAETEDLSGPTSPTEGSSLRRRLR